MKLVTSTNVMDEFRGVDGVITPEECALWCKKAGYDALDYNFCDLGKPGAPVGVDNWEENLRAFKKYTDEIGMPFTQTHLHMYDPADENVTDHAWERERLRRSVEGSGIVQGEWAVAHLLHRERKGFTHADYVQLNLDFWGPVVERAKELGYGVSFENMITYENSGKPMTYSSTAEDLIEFVEALHMPNVGINWDFGHAHLTTKDQASEIRKVGKWLRSIHVADNHRNFDEHIAPYYGTIKWEEMMKVLAEVDYKGEFTYEVHSFCSWMPRELRMSQNAHLVDIGRYLISVFEQERAKLKK